DLGARSRPLDRRLRRPGQGEYPPELLRHRARPAAVHRRPQPPQARTIHPRDAHSDPSAGGPRRGSPGRGARPAVESPLGDRRAAGPAPRHRHTPGRAHSHPRRRRLSGRRAAMKVVLFCGGAPVRLTEHDRPVPKPMVMIGYRPVLWHVMRWYAHWGMRDFVLCLGYGGDLIKRYFLDYSEALSNDFVLSAGTGDVRLLQADIRDWTITFADTGVNATISQRLRAVREHVR